MNPRFPVYIPSKGRAGSRLTMRCLEALGVSYSVIVEEEEYSAYAAVIGRDKLTVLDRAYQRDYETCDDLGESKAKGPGPARNFIWDLSIASGAKWHWVLDDNIQKFYRLNARRKVPVSDGTIFRCMEDFVLRYKNVAIAGPNYSFFVPQNHPRAPFLANTRIFSCVLIRNDIPFRWRGRYNEDTDLAIRVLKAGWCSIQFNAFLQRKAETQTLSGGNTDAFYAKEGTLAKSKMLVALHPGVAKLVHRYGRWHHHVDYGIFRTRLVKDPEAVIPVGVDNYGMRLSP